MLAAVITSGLRLMVGAVRVVAQPANMVGRRTAITAASGWPRVTRGSLPEATNTVRIGDFMGWFFWSSLFFIGAARGGFGTHLRATRLDATADCLDLLVLGDLGWLRCVVGCLLCLLWLG